AAANTPIALCEEERLADFADRFSDDTSYEEMQAPLSQRCAVGLARALQAGALYATAQSPSWNLEEFKPVLAAHAAATAGRAGAGAAGAAARALPGRAAGVPRPGRVRAAADPGGAARTGPAEPVPVQPGPGRRAHRQPHRIRHRRRDDRGQRDHRATRGRRG